MSEHSHSHGWIGARVLRKEDARLLAGAGEFVADIRLSGMKDVAFVRSQIAHGRLIGIRKPEGHEGAVFALGDLGAINVLDAGPEMASFRLSPYPPLASDKVRFAGQMIAACVASTRARAEDLADQVEVEIEELPAVVDCVAAMQPDAPRLFEAWPDNAHIFAAVKEGDPAAAAAAPIRISRQFRMNRQATVSLEGRGVVAYRDRRADELVIYLSTQGAHVMRIGIAQSLGLPEHKVRVIAPDVGGGFGGKNRLMPEEIAVAAIAMKVGHPVRWIEDRREHLLASVHARDHTYDLTITAKADGTLVGIEGDVYIDSGAYSLWPTGSFMETSMAARNLPGPYRLKSLQVNTWTVATNKAPMGPYRGVARPGACFVIERLVDAVAHELGREPIELRRQNIVTREELPFKTVGGMLFDTGDYVESIDTAVKLVGLPAIRERQKEMTVDGRAIGVGFAFYSEQSGHGAAEWMKRRGRLIPGYDTANIRINSDGTGILSVGTQCFGQGHDTTYAQIAAHELGLEPADITVRYGDTATTPFGFGSFGSRSIVFAGGAIGRACGRMAEKIKQIGAHLMQTEVGHVELRDGAVHGPSGSVSVKEVARVATIRQEMLPAGMDPLLETTATYEPAESGGVFSYGTHAAVVAVDPDSGVIEILDYVVAEDCGTMINPMIVDGQVQGGIAQGIGTALYEEIPFDASGQPLATTFADYHVPGAPEVPAVRIAHLLNPAVATAYGVKGVGEGGAIAPPAALGNAIADALRNIGAEVNETPMTPRRVSDAVAAARAARGSAA
ncbi:MAG: xanthine dehydrogenase family protein molybdopterin-binding subunit [Hyphomicrobiaceae bacterium]